MQLEKFREEVKERDDHKCRRCGNPTANNVHHLIKGGLGKRGPNERANGVLLCFDDHMEVENVWSKRLKASELHSENITYIEKEKYPGWKKIDWSN